MVFLSILSTDHFFFGSASDHIRMRLSYERSERMLSKMAETIPDVRVWCHFMLLEKKVL